MRKTAEQRSHPPLDIVDGGARIVAPIINGFNTGTQLGDSSEGLHADRVVVSLNHMQPTPVLPQVTYRIDEHDRIASVSESWDSFAILNHGGPAAADTVGRPLWDFLSGDVTRQVYRDLITRARSGRAITFSFRCDAPMLRRFMRMTMSSSANSGVTFDSLTLRVEPRDHVTVPVCDTPTDDLLRICGWCKRLAIGDEWMEVEAAIGPLGVFIGRPFGGVTHAMCPDCFSRVRAETDAEGQIFIAR